MQKQSHAVDVGIGIKMINAGSVEGAGAANNAMDFVTLLQQQIGQITSILTGDAGDERPFHERHSVSKGVPSKCSDENANAQRLNIRLNESKYRPRPEHANTIANLLHQLPAVKP